MSGSFISACARSTGTSTLKTHLNALQEAGAHPLCSRCRWHFTHVLLDTQTQLLYGTGHVAVSGWLLTLHSPEFNPLEYCLWGACKHSIYRNKPGSLEELRLSVEQYVREVPADTAERVGASFRERVQMCLERGGACTSSICANKRVAHSPFFK